MLKERTCIQHCINSECDVDDLDSEGSSITAGQRLVRKLGRHSNYLLYVPVVSCFLLLSLYCMVSQTPLSNFTRDPLAVTNGQPFYGFVSNICILFWCGTAAICFFSWSLKRRRGQTDVRNFLLFSGCLTLLLLLDDLFMLHESVYPNMGVRQRYVLSIYMILTLAYLIRFRKEIFKRHTTKLIIAFVFFMISLAADIFPISSDQWQYFLEDGAKLIGVISWFNYLACVCSEELTADFYPESTGA